VVDLDNDEMLQSPLAAVIGSTVAPLVLTFESLFVNFVVIMWTMLHWTTVKTSLVGRNYLTIWTTGREQGPTTGI
jgi:hypothetical protein